MSWAIFWLSYPSYNRPVQAKKLSIIVPVYNEKDTVETLIARVQTVKLPLAREIIAVDDASTDGSADLLDKMKEDGVVVVRHAKNRGKGAAIRTGLEKATGDLVLIQDADLEYDPSDFPTLLAPLLALIPGLFVLLFKRSHVIPYGPFLSLALVVSLFVGERILQATGMESTVSMLFEYYLPGRRF